MTDGKEGGQKNKQARPDCVLACIDFGMSDIWKDR